MSSLSGIMKQVLLVDIDSNPKVLKILLAFFYSDTRRLFQSI
jgi:hypothetical protein